MAAHNLSGSGSPMKPSFAQLRRFLYAAVCSLALSAGAFAQDSGAAELLAAQQAVERADRADADQYAPDMMAMARQQQVPGDSWQVLRVERGQTLSDLFDKAGIPATTLHRVLDHPGAREALTKLRPGAEIAFDMPLSGDLRSIRFDRDAIAAAGYSAITPVLVTNHRKFAAVDQDANGEVAFGDQLLKVSAKDA